MTIQQTAAAIAALINSRPMSPREAEIAEILGGMDRPTAGLTMSPEHAGHYAEWGRLIEAHLREFGGNPPAEESPTIERVIRTLADRIHATPARTWGDVLLYAEVCFWDTWPGTDPEGPDAQAEMDAGIWSVEGDPVIKLLGAIFTVAGIGRPSP